MNNIDHVMEFYKGKKVLLTGHTGFKGTWMSVILELLGAKVCGYSLPLNTYSFYHKVSPHLQYHVEGDIADEDKVSFIAGSFQPEIIFHFASHSSLDGSMKIPDFILRTNLMGTVNILETVRQIESIKSVVVVTSDKCYQNLETDELYKEDSILGAKDPYSTSKVCQELLTSCYMDTFFREEGRLIGIATARASNVIGPGDNNISRLMPYLLDSFANERIAKIRNPYAVRPWQHVLDVLYGYLLLAKNLYESAGVTMKYNGAYNFGPNKDGFVQVGHIAAMAARYFENASYSVIKGKDHIRNEAKVLKLDSTKAKDMLGWKPKRTLEETIEFTCNFVIKEKRGENTAELCRDSIRQYLEIL
ncbi:CDP-glucose 4,6-dehydratase [Parablautia muri]|uniref:CDP-glucose 4,6-dehydratase n=1 Tax=Parablautia muri TaxID=2320879 RepID=A0A9X5BEQ4_9FIRM|nr:CDP-glucose 4,6-dehydratase [Parablautia muri]NBJ92535.1 CDP-glucose 4,6-dehydratase [Parablautia muri]